MTGETDSVLYFAGAGINLSCAESGMEPVGQSNTTSHFTGKWANVPLILETGLMPVATHLPPVYSHLPFFTRCTPYKRSVNTGGKSAGFQAGNAVLTHLLPILPCLGPSSKFFAVNNMCPKKTGGLLADSTSSPGKRAVIRLMVWRTMSQPSLQQHLTMAGCCRHLSPSCFLLYSQTSRRLAASQAPKRENLGGFWKACSLLPPVISTFR